MLFGVGGSDVTVIAGAVLLAIVVSFAAGILPARRATSVNPIEALRVE